MRIRVERGERDASEGLLRFMLGEHTIEVDDLLDRWYGESVDYFRVRDEVGNLYVLKHVRGHDCWELAGFTGTGSRGTGTAGEGSHALH